jgi:thioesterase domain-containing protein
MPSYMIPSAIVLLDYLPLTVNGKVNKKALPKPDQIKPEEENTHIAPLTETEKMLAGIWQQVLGKDRVSADDNFFYLGGHSLLAVKLFAQIKNTIGNELPISTLYANPVLAQLAKCVEGKTGEDPWQSLVCITKSKIKLPLYFIHHGGGTLEYAQRLALYLDKDQPVYGLQPIGLNGVDQPLDTIEAMAAYYTKLIISNQPEGPYQLAGYSTGGYIAYEIAKNLTESGKKVNNLFILDTYPNFSKYTYHGIALRYIWMNSINLFTSYKNLKHFYENKSLTGIAYNFIYDLAMKIRKVLSLEPQVIVSEEEIKYNFKQAMRKKILAISFRAEKNYRTTPYYGPLVFIRAIENEVEYVRNSDLGWRKFVEGILTVYDVPHTHHTLFDSKENANHIASLIQKHINESNLHLGRNQDSKHLLVPDKF